MVTTLIRSITLIWLCLRFCLQLKNYKFRALKYFFGSPKSVSSANYVKHVLTKLHHCSTPYFLSALITKSFLQGNKTYFEVTKCRPPSTRFRRQVFITRRKCGGFFFQSSRKVYVQRKCRYVDVESEYGAAKWKISRTMNCSRFPLPHQSFLWLSPRKLREILKSASKLSL